MKLGSLASLLIVLTLASVSFGQVSDVDKAAAVTRAKQFTQRLRRTQDIKRLLPEFFTSDFLKRIEQDSGHNTLVFIEMADKRKFTLTEKQRQRYYFASMNWFYLVWLYNCSSDPQHFGDDDVKIKIPPGVKSILKRNPFLSLLMHEDEMSEMKDADFENLLPKSASDVEALSKNLEHLNSLFRKSMGQLRRMSDKRYDNVLTKCHVANSYRVEMASCNNPGNCPGVPKGVPLIGVVSPFFEFIDIARLNGSMKIVRLFLWDESLK